jgi:hypothetical protein
MIDQEIQNRMDAYRGNPQALMQRYAQSQQLIDLLALQKLKSEKEAAARQMQMGAPGQMPTVAQQREQQVLDMTKQEVAQRVGQVAQQQAQQQRENLQRAAQTGIAQAPSPNMMPAQAMASGGIVAFAGPGGSEVKSDETAFTRGLKSLFSVAPPSAEEEARRRRREELAGIQAQYDLGPFQGAFTLPAEQYDVKTAVRKYIQSNYRELVDNPQLFAAFKANPEAFVTGKMRTAEGVIRPTTESQAAQPAEQPAPQAQAAPPTEPQGLVPGPQTLPAGPLPAPGGAGISAGLELPTRREGAAPAGAPNMAPGVGPAAPQPGIAGALGQQAAPSALQQAFEKSQTEALGVKPEDVATAREAAYSKRFDPLYAEQAKVQQQGLEALQERMRQQQAMQDPLGAWLSGAQGRTIGEVLGSAGRAGRNYQQEQMTARAALEDQLQKLREAQASGKITQAETAYGKGEEARKQALEERSKSAQTVGSYEAAKYGADTRADIAVLNAQIKDLARNTLTPAQQEKIRLDAEKMYEKDLADPKSGLFIAQTQAQKAGLSPEQFRQREVEKRHVQLLKAALATPQSVQDLVTNAGIASAGGAAVPPAPPGAVRPKTKG